MNKDKNDRGGPPSSQAPAKKTGKRERGSGSGAAESRGGSREGNIGHQADSQGTQGRR